MLYDLMKRAYRLNREDKEFLHENWDKIVVALRRKKKKKKDIIELEDKLPKEYEYLEQGDNVEPSPREIYFSKKILEKKVQAQRLHDPETPEQMINLISVMEKFINADDNRGYNQLCLFLSPLSSGAKKLVLRPYRLVGLIRKLEKLSRQFDRTEKTPELCDNFCNCLDSIKQRLSSSVEKNSHKMAKSLEISKESVDNAFNENIQRLMEEGWTIEELEKRFDIPKP